MHLVVQKYKVYFNHKRQALMLITKQLKIGRHSQTYEDSGSFLCRSGMHTLTVSVPFLFFFLWSEFLGYFAKMKYSVSETWKRRPLETKTAGLRRPHLIRTITSNLMLNNLKMKTTCHPRPYVFGTKGGLCFQVSLYLKFYVINVQWNLYLSTTLGISKWWSLLLLFQVLFIHIKTSLFLKKVVSGLRWS